MRTPKRSSWASGNGYVPWNSTGFCVARTMKGDGRGRVTPSVETCCSLIASRSADCVRGEARLISSARSTFAKIGPSLKLKLPSRGLKTEEPRMSAGSRSGVNCTRRKVPEKQRASALASVVLPDAGHVLQEEVVAGEEGDEDVVEGLALSEDDAGQLALRGPELVGGRCGHGLSVS